MWRKLLEEGAIDWSDIGNKPTKFPPENHPHEEYANGTFFFKDMKYDLHHVIEQIVVNLEKEHNFKLYT